MRVPAVSKSETIDLCEPAVLQLDQCKNFSHGVDTSKPARLLFHRKQFFFAANKFDFCQQFLFAVQKDIPQNFIFRCTRCGSDLTMRQT